MTSDMSQPRGGEDAAVTLSEEQRAEFAARFTESFRVLWLVAVGIVSDSASAEDVVQEAALLALSKLNQFQPGTNFTAWMAQMVRFVALNYARKTQKHRAAPLEADEQIGAMPIHRGGGPDVPLTQRGQLMGDQGHFDDQLMSALSTVGEDARACLFLRILADMEYADIAKVLNIPEGTAMSHVHRARQRLRQRLAPHALPADLNKGGSA
jgi:RNA polymerase sigma-70 factor (ECF subfamily)